jgi:hypothetical protein
MILAIADWPLPGSMACQAQMFMGVPRPGVQQSSTKLSAAACRWSCPGCEILLPHSRAGTLNFFSLTTPFPPTSISSLPSPFRLNHRPPYLRLGISGTPPGPIPPRRAACRERLRVPY